MRRVVEKAEKFEASRRRQYANPLQREAGRCFLGVRGRSQPQAWRPCAQGVELGKRDGEPRLEAIKQGG